MNVSCQGCRDGAAFPMPFSMAFQPIVDLRTGEVFAQEALVRGVNGEGARSVLEQVDVTNRYAFDQQCRVKAIELASRLQLTETPASLSINFMPDAVYEPRACIRQTLIAAKRLDLPLDRIIFEFTEDQRIDTAHVLHILNSYREIGFKTAIDDFGAGYAGLTLLSKFRPDIVKIDMELIRGIDTNRTKQMILRHLVDLLRDLEIEIICEGIETPEELEVVRDMGVDLIQGYLLAAPRFEEFVRPEIAEYVFPTKLERHRRAIS